MIGTKKSTHRALAGLPDPATVDALRTAAMKAVGEMTRTFKCSDITALTIIAAGVQLLSVGSSSLDVTVDVDGKKVTVTEADMLAVSQALLSKALQHVLAPLQAPRHRRRRPKKDAHRRPKRPLN